VAKDGALSSRRSSVHRATSGKRQPSVGRVASGSVGKGSLITPASADATSSIEVTYADDDADPSPAASDDEEFATDPVTSPARDHHALSKKDLFTLGVIGRGQNGAVLKAIHLPTLTRVALKSIYAHDRSTRHQLLHELTAYLHFDSPFLVPFLGAYYEHDLIVLATEYCDLGSLHSFVARNGPLREHPRVFKQIAFQCVAGVKYMHDRHALHRDIKAENYLIDHFASAKLADFGLLRDLGDTAALSNTFLGTMSYVSQTAGSTRRTREKRRRLQEGDCFLRCSGLLILCNALSFAVAVVFASSSCRLSASCRPLIRIPATYGRWV
jgi:hypothetical protein